jgi:hypothetical protein
MATVNVSSELDVINKFNSLMRESVASESLYIRAKETLEALYTKETLDGADKAEVIANTIAGMSNAITASAMATALQWAAQERQLEMDKLKLSKDLDILDQEIQLREAQVDKLQWDSLAEQAQMIRMYGTPVVVEGVVMSLADAGKVYNDTLMVVQQTDNLVQEKVLIVERVKEVQAGTHRTVADTVVNHGAWNYTLSSNGIVTTPVKTTPNAVVPLSDIQRVIATEQAKGYTYNAWANATTASAGMLGTAVASDGAIDDISTLVTLFQTTLTQLQQVDLPIIPV